MCCCRAQPSNLGALLLPNDYIANKRRQEILRTYAQQLTDDDLEKLAAATPGMSGRDLRDVCEQAERRWASKARFMIRKGQA